MTWREAQAEAIADHSQRVLALAEMPFEGDAIDYDDLAGGMTLLGFAGLIDPPRPEAVTASTTPPR